MAEDLKATQPAEQKKEEVPSKIEEKKDVVDESALDAESKQYKALRTAKWGRTGVAEDIKAPVRLPLLRVIGVHCVEAVDKAVEVIRRLAISLLSVLSGADSWQGKE